MNDTQRPLTASDVVVPNDIQFDVDVYTPNIGCLPRVHEYRSGAYRGRLYDAEFEHRLKTGVVYTVSKRKQEPEVKVAEINGNGSHVGCIYNGGYVRLDSMPSISGLYYVQEYTSLYEYARSRSYMKIKEYKWRDYDEAREYSRVHEYNHIHEYPPYKRKTISTRQETKMNQVAPLVLAEKKETVKKEEKKKRKEKKEKKEEKKKKKEEKRKEDKVKEKKNKTENKKLKEMPKEDKSKENVFVAAAVVQTNEVQKEETVQQQQQQEEEEEEEEQQQQQQPVQEQKQSQAQQEAPQQQPPQQPQHQAPPSQQHVRERAVESEPMLLGAVALGGAATVTASASQSNAPIQAGAVTQQNGSESKPDGVPPGGSTAGKTVEEIRHSTETSEVSNTTTVTATVAAQSSTDTKATNVAHPAARSDEPIPNTKTRSKADVVVDTPSKAVKPPKIAVAATASETTVGATKQPRTSPTAVTAPVATVVAEQPQNEPSTATATLPPRDSPKNDPTPSRDSPRNQSPDTTADKSPAHSPSNDGSEPEISGAALGSILRTMNKFRFSSKN